MILSVKDINVSFKKENQKSFFGKEKQKVLHDISLDLRPGECLGIIGESGSGKSTLGRVVMGLLRPESGEVMIEGESLYKRRSKLEKMKIKRASSIVFQDYTTSVNSRFKVRDIINESLRQREMDIGGNQKDREEYIINILKQVGLSQEYINRYPHELSGGQLQRVCIARALAVKPKFILFDEAISALDASTQVQVMNLLLDLRKKYDFSYLFITHDLTSITYMCDRVLFIKEGEIVERVEDINELGYLENEYAKKLLEAVIC